jgi:hypothetical protein
MSSVKEAAERMRDHMLTGKGWNGLVTVSEKDLDIVVRFALDAAAPNDGREAETCQCNARRPCAAFYSWDMHPLKCAKCLHSEKCHA